MLLKDYNLAFKRHKLKGEKTLDASVKLNNCKFILGNNNFISIESETYLINCLKNLSLEDFEVEQKKKIFKKSHTRIRKCFK